MAIIPENINTVSVEQLTPANFNLTDKIPHSIDGTLFSGTVQQLVDILRLNSSAFQNELKFLQVDNQYIVDNFDATGLGTNLCLGWARCNGNNGTVNMDGLVPIGHGATFNTVGQFGGASTHTLTNAQLPIHAHSNGIADDDSVLFVYGSTAVGMPGLATRTVSTESLQRNFQGLTSQVGSNQAHNNMQPYVVTLIIKKL
jgi:hypothetical protein